MTNQTIVAVPPNIEEPQVLKGFLNRLIEKLDVVLGYRGDQGYISTAVATKTISGAIEAVKASLAEQELSFTALNDRLEDLEEQDVTTVLEETMFLKGWSLKFTGIVSNGPVTPALDYNIGSAERTATGVYTATLAQTTILSENILDQSVSTVASEGYEIYFIPGSGEFTLNVYSAGVLTDPTTEVSCAGLFSKSGGLPTP